MPVPKKLEKTYGKAVGHLQNLGYSNSVAKKKIDKAMSEGKLKPSKRRVP